MKKFFTLFISGWIGFGFGLPAFADDLGKALDAPLFVKALDYMAIPKIEGCEPRVKRAEIYHYCRDSQQIYDKAVANAKAKNQPLMVIFGFNTCPACLAYEKYMFDPKRPVNNAELYGFRSNKDYAAYEKKAKAENIAVVRIHSRSEHGLKLADNLGVTKMAKDRGWHRVWSPFILFVNPKTGAMHSESYWEAEDHYCNPLMDLAVNMEGIGMATKGKSYYPRKRCKRE